MLLEAMGWPEAFVVAIFTIVSFGFLAFVIWWCGR